jgi:WD40 repeat protein
MLASGSCDGEMKLWEWEGGTCLRTIRSTRAILALNFASDGNQLLSGNDRELLAVWDVESGDCLRTIVGDEEASWLGSVTLSADGNWLATVSADQKVKLWDGRKGDLQRRFTCQGSRPWQVALSADRRLVAAGTEEGTIFLWEWHTGKCLRILLCDRPYEHMNITGITGLAEAQRASLIALGATEEGNG